METRILADVALTGALVMEANESGFPANPRIGTFVIKDQCLYGYLKVGTMTTWYPFSNRTRFYVHTQTVPAQTWTVTHGLNSADVWFQVRDTTGNIVSVSKTEIDLDSFRLNFTTPFLGTVTVVAPDTLSVADIQASSLLIGRVSIDTSGIYVNGAPVLTNASISDQLAAAVAPKADSKNVYTKSETQNLINTVVGTAPAALEALNQISTSLASGSTDISALTSLVATKANADLSNVTALPTFVVNQLKGDTGAQGLMGPQGPVGLPGPIGPQGPKGDTGATGFTGKDGKDGTNAVVSATAINSALGYTPVSPNALASVAVTGSYNDLSDKPAFAVPNGDLTKDFAVKALTVNGDVLPLATGVYNLGSPTKKFASIYTKDLHLDAQTLYVNGVPVLGSATGALILSADPNQAMKLVTTGTGATSITSQASVLVQAPTLALTGATTVNGGLTVTGNLNVKGAVTSVESANTTIKDNIITVNSGETSAGVALGVAGIEVDRGTSGVQRLVWIESSGKWSAGATGSEVALATENYVASYAANNLARVATTGSYSDLTDKPTLFSGAYADLTGKPASFSGAYADLTGKPTLFSGSYNDLSNKPTLFSGSYNDLTNKPASTSQVNADWNATTGLAQILNKPTLFAGTFAALTGKPTTISGYGITDAAALGSTVGTALGTASAGTATTAARSDHVHPKQVLAQSDITSALGFTPINPTSIGIASGVAGLDATGKVPSTQLPSYVDDVLEYTNLAAFPAKGETGKIYVALDTNKPYRWSGSTYIAIVASPGSTDSVAEGTTNLYFTTARARGALSAGTGITYNATTGVITGPDLSAYAPIASPTFTGTVTAAAVTLTGAITASSSVLNVGSGQLYKDATGKIGMGTTAPGARLAVVGTAYSPTITLVDGASIAWDTSVGQTATVTLAGNRALAAPNNLVDGGFYAITIRQDASGNRLLTWNTIFKFAGAAAPTLSTGASNVDTLVFKYENGVLLEQGRSIGIA